MKISIVVVMAFGVLQLAAGEAAAAPIPGTCTHGSASCIGRQPNQPIFCGPEFTAHCYPTPVQVPGQTLTCYGGCYRGPIVHFFDLMRVLRSVAPGSPDLVEKVEKAEEKLANGIDRALEALDELTDKVDRQTGRKLKEAQATEIFAAIGRASVALSSGALQASLAEQTGGAARVEFVNVINGQVVPPKAVLPRPCIECNLPVTVEVMKALPMPEVSFAAFDTGTKDPKQFSATLDGQPVSARALEDGDGDDYVFVGKFNAIASGRFVLTARVELLDGTVLERMVHVFVR